MTSRSWKRWRRGGMGLGLLVLAVILGCDAQSRYKTLSVFFDGVPDPSAPAGSALLRRSKSGKPLFVHKPYFENKCNSCHINSSDIFARAKVKPNVCITCHTAVPAEHRVMHGPVATNACIMCHVPHTSQVEHLLKRSSPDVCIQCHLRPTLGPAPAEHHDEKASCITCHSGHGGDDRRFLRKEVAAATTVPTTSPSKEAH